MNIKIKKHYNNMFKCIRADTVLRALELPSGLKLDRCLTKHIDYNTVESVFKTKVDGGENKPKLQKATRIEYNLTPDGIHKLAAISNTHCSVRSVNDFACTILHPLPVVYLFVIANDDLEITVPDGHVLVKYGYTNNIQRRTNEHVKTYGPAIFLKYHVYIDPSHLKDAENDVRSFFKSTSWHVEKSKYNELAIIPKALMQTVISEYKRIGEHYLQKITQLSTTNDALVRELNFAKELLAEKDRTIGLALKLANSKS